MRHLYLSLAATSVLAAAAHAQVAGNAEGVKALEPFVGVWNLETISKPAKWSPDGGKNLGQEVIVKYLKDRYLLGKSVDRTSGAKALWVMARDPNSDSYPFWMFDNKGNLGGEWKNKWDTSTKTLTGVASDTPAGWTSGGINRFPDKNTDVWSAWIKDETGALLLDIEAKKTRRPDDTGEKMLAAWAKKDAADLPTELDVLDRLAGTWDATAVSKVAVWTPAEVRTTSKVTRQWILDGRFLQETSEISDGTEAMSIMTYDPQNKAYRSWWFSSEGYNNKSTGSWDDATNSMSFKADLPDGLTARSSVQFADKDHHDWKVVVTDGEGKVYFHGEWSVSRRK